MEDSKKTFFTSRNIAILGALTAIVLVLQLALGSVKVGATQFSVVLIPIVLGSVLLGCYGGMFLGFVFGAVVLVQGILGVDVFTNVLFLAQPVATSLICLVKGVACGLLPALFYKALAQKNEKFAIIGASAIAPIANTGLFVLLMFVFKNAFTTSLMNAGFLADAQSFFYFIVIGCAGINFIIELIVNLVASSALLIVIKALKKK